MPRIARIVAEGFPHHVTQRGNNREDVFFDDADRAVYLGLLRREAERHDLAVLGYCLMTNHVHLVAVPERADSLAKAIGRAHYFYTRYANRRYKRSGHLWQNRFFSCALDEMQLLVALRYVDRNPVRARLVRRAWRYPWSSAALHAGVGATPAKASALVDFHQWSEISAGLDWRQVLIEADDAEEAEALRERTRTGWPLGSARFVKALEKKYGRPLAPLPRGRPRKSSGDKARAARTRKRGRKR
ncbi:MAG TPA: transposase [Sumerlaeia bacterium]|nr:transposase [Sumerlaeia bacterium]